MNLFFLILVFLGTLFLFYRAYKNTHKVALNKVNLSNIDSNHPKGSLLNILQILDMHLEKISVSPEQLYNKLIGEEIDLIALTGDFLDKTQYSKANSLFKGFKLFKSPIWNLCRVRKS